MLLALTLPCACIALRCIYRGGTTWNDHAVAAVVLGCMGLYPLLAWGSGAQGLHSMLWICIFAPGPLSITALFVLLDRRVEAGRVGLAIAALSQLSLSFALWAGLLVLLRLPVALCLGASPLWPGSLLGLPLAVSLWGCLWTARRHNHLQRIALPIPGLGAPLRIVHLSDLHASPVMTGPQLDAIVRIVNAQKPDLVLITGDLLMPFSEAHHPYLTAALGRLAAPTCCCPGNHDLPVLEALVAELEVVGCPMLVDEARRLVLRGQAVEVVGLQFHWRDPGARHAALLARNPRPAESLSIGLIHDPRSFGGLPEGRLDLVLSGHTHGGQVGTDMFGWPGSVLGLLGLYDQGLFRRGSSILYVHRGNWHTGLPPRMGVGGEIVVFDLSPA